MLYTSKSCQLQLNLKSAVFSMSFLFLLLPGRLAMFIASFLLPAMQDTEAYSNGIHRLLSISDIGIFQYGCHDV